MGNFIDLNTIKITQNQIENSAKILVIEKVAQEQPKLTLWICKICEYPNTIKIPSCQNKKGLGVGDKYKD